MKAGSRKPRGKKPGSAKAKPAAPGATSRPKGNRKTSKRRESPPPDAAPRAEEPQLFLTEGACETGDASKSPPQPAARETEETGESVPQPTACEAEKPRASPPAASCGTEVSGAVQPAHFAFRAGAFLKTVVGRVRRWTISRPWRSVGVVAVLFGVVFLYLLLATPSWCEPPRIAPEQRQQVRNNLVAAEQAFTESLRAGMGPFVYHIHQDDLNRWIAMRREIYPLLDRLTPPEILDPFVLFTEGRVRIAGRHRDRLLGSVFSLDVIAGVEGNDLVLRAVAARVGRIRIPFGLLIGAGVMQPVEKEAGETWPGSPRIEGDLVSGLRVGAEARWKNGGFSYRVTDVQVHEGRLDLTVEPLGRQEGAERRLHKSSR